MPPSWTPPDINIMAGESFADVFAQYFHNITKRETLGKGQNAEG